MSLCCKTVHEDMGQRKHNSKLKNKNKAREINREGGGRKKKKKSVTATSVKDD